MKLSLRKSPQTILVFDEFLQAARDWKYGYDISRSTGLKSGTLYPILMRLAERKVLETRWEAPEPGRPPRHMYRLTVDGLRYAREQLLSVSKRAVTRPAFSRVKI